METAAYTVKAGAFEGPLDLLLSLVEQRKLFINDISLAQIADEYIAHVQRLEAFPVADIAHFVLVAATLVLIKSKSLLPNLSLSQEEQSDIADLEERLEELRRMKELARMLRGRYGNNILFERISGKERIVVFSPGTGCTLTSIAIAMQAVLGNLPRKEHIARAIVAKVVSIEDMIVRLMERIRVSMEMSFREFACGDRASKVEVIVSFLAMLELVKQGSLMVVQETHFADVRLVSSEVAVPRYG